nr:hypothetical protein [Candidatus Sigynarchaeum springense]
MVNSRDPKSTIAAVQHPTEGEAGNTGTWRTFKPVIDERKCILMKSPKARCHKCWLYCPEAMVTRTRPPKILEYCKGCGICAAECTHKAITMEKE